MASDVRERPIASGCREGCSDRVGALARLGQGLHAALPAGVFSCPVFDTLATHLFGAHRSMASLADTPELVGFFSYSREDDEGSGGQMQQVSRQSTSRTS